MLQNNLYALRRFASPLYVGGFRTCTTPKHWNVDQNIDQSTLGNSPMTEISGNQNPKPLGAPLTNTVTHGLYPVKSKDPVTSVDGSR